MKKNLKLFTLAFALMFAIVVKVSAAEVPVSTERDLKECVKTTGNVCVLGSNINLTSTVEIKDGVEVTISLDKTGGALEITADDSVDTLFKVTNGRLVIDGVGRITGNVDVFYLVGNTVTGGEATKAELEIGEDVEVISNTSNGVYLIGNGAKVDVYGRVVTNSTKYAAIQGNGSEPTDTVDKGNTEINIYEGAEVIANYDMAIYHPQYGTVNVTGGTITGTTGIEMRAGVLMVTGGKITGTATPSSSIANGNGSTTLGAGIAVAQHTTKNDIVVAILGGTVEGHSAVYESNPQGNDVSDTNKVLVAIVDGTFNAINGGTEAVHNETDSSVMVVGGTYNTEIAEELLTEDSKLEKVNGSYAVKTAWNITVEDTENGTVTAPEKVYPGETVKLDIEAKEGYKVASIKVVDDLLGDEIEVKDNSFTMPNMSVIVEVTFAKEEVVPNTGDNVITFIVIGLISLIAAGYAANKLRKNA